MSFLLEIARGAIVVNLGLLVAMGYTWGQSFHKYGASHTFVFLLFGGVLFLQNLVWGYLYLIDTRYISWFMGADPDMQLGLLSLCGLETLGLGFLAWITLR